LGTLVRAGLGLAAAGLAQGRALTLGLGWLGALTALRLSARLRRMTGMTGVAAALTGAIPALTRAGLALGLGTGLGRRLGPGRGGFGHCGRGRLCGEEAVEQALE
jgi:hypothetical protein